MEDQSIKAWIEERRFVSGLKAEPIGVSDTLKWEIKDGSIRHLSNHFFAIRGLDVADASDNDLQFFNQPIIDQPEIGILGFLFREGPNGIQIFLQAKTEPGNIGGTQIAPTVQATWSNYSRIHKGKPTEFLDFFLRSAIPTAPGRLQSEQGTRFLGKYNRNVSIFLEKDTNVGNGGDPWKWIPVAKLFEVIDEDYLINTDARSVLITTDWFKMVEGRMPFEGHSAGIGRKLLISLDRESRSDYFTNVLKNYRDTFKFKATLKDLYELEGWEKNEHGFHNQDCFSVNFYRVEVNDREVDEWSQPLIQSNHQGKVVLYCQERDGCLQFLVMPSVEIGFKECVQFGPSINIVDNHPTNAILDIDESETTIIGECLQSDEGGRFFRSSVHYSIQEVSSDFTIESHPNHCWMSLRDIYDLLGEKSYFTNEFRSVLSLILKFI